MAVASTASWALVVAVGLLSAASLQGAHGGTSTTGADAFQTGVGACTKTGCDGSFESPAYYSFDVNGLLAMDTSFDKSAGAKGPPFKCCRLCAKEKNCVYWSVTETADSYTCSLYDGKKAPKVSKKAIPNTIVGGGCNPTMHDDPHFVGHRGTHFDFNGDLDQSFAIISDTLFHVNMKLEGYYDNNSSEGASITKDGKVLRTWAREVGVLYQTRDSQQHVVRLVARRGNEQLRKGGFLANVELDGKTQQLPKVGSSLALGGDAALNFVGLEKSGPYEVEYYTLTIPGRLAMDVRMRIANPKLQLPNDAFAHFNLAFTKFEATPQIHGVLGQTYRADSERFERTVKYAALSKLLGGRALQADGESGAGFLDGTTQDYVTKSVTSTDCTFCKYGQVGVTLAEVVPNHAASV